MNGGRASWRNIGAIPSGDGTYFVSEKVQIPDGTSVLCWNPPDATNYYRESQYAVYAEDGTLLNCKTGIWMNSTTGRASNGWSSMENPSYCRLAIRNKTGSIASPAEYTFYAF